MDPFTIVAAIISLLGGKALLNEYSEKLLRQLFIKFGFEKPTQQISYAEKLRLLTENINRSSTEMDELLVELGRVAEERERAVEKVEADLMNLQTREKELKERVDHLQNIPLPVVEELSRLNSAGEKRSARRDYILFGAGVVVSTVLTIVLKMLGLG